MSGMKRRMMHRAAIAALVLLASAPWARAQTGDGGGEAVETTLIYSVNRTPENPFDTARAVQVITAEEIWRRNARNLPELLMEEAGIFVQQTNYGGGSPIMRGLIGKQILVLIDGVRINNATYRFGPIQYLSTIDIDSVERIEIVRGADSVLTGFALGGIINVITKKGPPVGDADAIGARAFSRFSSADSGATGRFEGYGSTERVRYFGGVTYRNAEDVEAGGAVGEQPWTGYDEIGGQLSLDYFMTDERTLSFRYHTLEQDEVPRTDRLAQGNNLVFDFEPQRLQLATFSYSDLTARGWSDSMRLTLSWNRQDEGRQEIRTSSPTTERQLDDRQDVFGANLELSSFLGSANRLLYGVDFFSESINSTRTDVNLVTGSLSPKRGSYTDGASYRTLGIYLQDRFEISERFSLTAGGRYSVFETSGQEDSSVGVLDLDGTDSELTGSAGFVWRAAKDTRLVGSVTRAFRGPNIDDVSAFDVRNNGTEVPNPDLRPETMLTYEVGLKHQSENLEGSAFYYRSNLDGLIERTNGTSMGLPFFDLNGNGVQDPGEANVLQKQNIGRGRIQGVELDFRYRLASQWTMRGNYTYTDGEDAEDGEPLSRIPPGFGTIGLRWAAASGWQPWTEAVYHFAQAQRQISSRDAGDARIGPDGTDGFNLVHLRTGFSPLRQFRISVSVENLFDEEYKYHASGVFRPGRQLVLGGEIRF